MPGARRLPFATAGGMSGLGQRAPVECVLPYEQSACFGAFFTKLDESLDELGLTNYGVTITSLEEVFLKVKFLRSIPLKPLPRHNKS